MTTRTILTGALVCILVGTVAFSLVAYSAGFIKPTESFILEASGSAYDRRHHENVYVSLSVRGDTKGKLIVEMAFHIRGGSVVAENYGTFSVIKGSGVLIQRHHFIFLNMKISGGYYGGQKTTWNLHGHAGNIQANGIPVTLKASRIVLPVQGRPVLYDLLLTGTVTSS